MQQHAGMKYKSRVYMEVYNLANAADTTLRSPKSETCPVSANQNSLTGSDSDAPRSDSSTHLRCLLHGSGSAVADLCNTMPSPAPYASLE